MSDQNVVTDWRAYFAALGPGKPFTPEESAAMAALVRPEAALIMDETPGNLMTRLALDGPTCLDGALSAWLLAGKPRAWLTLGELVWWCDSASLPSRGKVRSRS